MKAIILAGGKGTRLSPYTTVFPKPLVPIGEKPILDIVIQQLYYYGFRDITLSVGYLAELIQTYFANHNGKYEHLDIKYVKEKEPLGTSGAIALVPDLPDTFLVMNGDVLTTIDYSKLMNLHKEQNAVLTIATYKKRVKIDLGVLGIDDNNIVNGYTEKPIHNYLVSMGIYIFDKRVLKYIKKNKYLDFPDLVKTLIKNKERVISYLSKDKWLDIGRREDYERATDAFEKNKNVFLPFLK